MIRYMEYRITKNTLVLAGALGDKDKLIKENETFPVHTLHIALILKPYSARRCVLKAELRLLMTLSCIHWQLVPFSSMTISRGSVWTPGFS